MMKHLIRANDEFAELAGRTLSWSIWFTLMVIGTAIWMLIDLITRGHFDPDYTNLILILTIITALDAGATKLFQLSLRKKDERREIHQQEQMNAISALTVEIKKALDRTEERDGDALERDTVIRNLVVRLLDAIEEQPKGGDAHGSRCVA